MQRESVKSENTFSDKHRGNVMKPARASAHRGDTTALDLIAIIAAVAVVAAVLLPALAKSKSRTSRIGCINSLKQVGLAFRIWACDNGDKYPAQVSTNAGGVMELVAAGWVAPQFVVMSNELSTPKLLHCPNDPQRIMASVFPGLSDTNVSYFVVPEADETLPEVWLSGDRNLATNNVALKPGLFILKTNQVMSWTTAIHNNYGNLGLADGSAQEVTSRKLMESATNALRAYYEATTNASFRIAIP
jgi:hypothetical protein